MRPTYAIRGGHLAGTCSYPDCIPQRLGCGRLILPHLTSSPDSIVQKSFPENRNFRFGHLFLTGFFPFGDGLEIYKVFLVESGATVLDKLMSSS